MVQRLETSVWLQAFGPLAIAIGLSGVACQAPVPARPKPLEVKFAGCDELETGPVCLYAGSGQRVLRLWVSDETSPPRCELDGQPSPCAWRRLEGGWAAELKPAPAAERLRLEARRAGAVFTWQMRLGTQTPCERVDRAVDRYQAGQVDVALEELGAQEAEGGYCAARAAGLRGRLHLAAGRIAEAGQALETEFERSRSLGALGSAAQSLNALAFVQTFLARDFASARRSLDLLAGICDQVSMYTRDLEYSRGLLARESGDLRGALAALRRAVLEARRLEVDHVRSAAEMALAETLRALGRGDEAIRLLEAALAGMPEAGPACPRVAVLSNLGWWGILEQARGVAVADPKPVLRSALKLLEGDCQDAGMHANALVNLGLYELLAGDPAEAEAHLVRAREVKPQVDAYLSDWLLDLEGRLALLRGDPTRAQGRFEALWTSSAPLSDARWRAALGLARTHAQAGRTEAALDAYRLADALLDDQLRMVPISAGRGGLVHSRLDGAAEWIALLLAQGDFEQAVQVARRSRVRVYQMLWRTGRLARLEPARQAGWERGVQVFQAVRSELDALRQQRREAAGDALGPIDVRMSELSKRARAALDQAYLSLPPGLRAAGKLQRPGPGELFLVFHPVPDGWVGFALDEEGLQVEQTPPIPPQASPAALSSILLRPFNGRVERADRIVLMPSGALDGVDFHALPTEAGVLLTEAEVVWSLDLPQAPERAGTAARRVVLVADPNGDLPWARADRTALTDLFTSRPSVQLQVLAGQQAGRLAVMEALKGADLFHFSGHARHAGTEGWASELSLAKGQGLSVSDVLALERAPERVVLAACQAVGLEGPTGKANVGLAQAFIAMGSREVVAATRPLDDGLASRISRALHAGPLRSLTSSLRRAQLGLLGQDRAGGWDSLRVLVP